MTPKPQTLDDLLATAYEQILYASERAEIRETREDAAEVRGALWGARNVLQEAIHRFEEEETAARDLQIALETVTGPGDLLGGAS
ncbi:hypothetical protein [Marinitenerispora sediminis]|uniref:Uncharacterized protein n=1 Tax=Marinitenerispora sediminis TaxID=1931232 RepID=A0A368T6R0_9ACTN|nr:hypothetical protein [Marinitenerispora sediminis]RCV51181.1 hypothetical protein DEF23_20875 [Marinitenerispora sediminis]RCV59338.1 hypothetical protein DEF24_10230 [Marinitenerispora sediminis]